MLLGHVIKRHPRVRVLKLQASVILPSVNKLSWTRNYGSSECSKLFSESGSLKTHLTLIQEKSHLLVKNVPNHFLRRSHFPVHCSLFNERKSVVSIKNSTFSLLTHFCLSPLFSSNMSLSMFWLLRRSLTMILQRIFEWRKESCWVVSLISNSSFLTIDMTKIVNIISNDFFS